MREATQQIETRNRLTRAFHKELTGGFITG
jgi:hypothetical protein